jgi:hypothetical protein
VAGSTSGGWPGDSAGTAFEESCQQGGGSGSVSELSTNHASDVGPAAHRAPRDRALTHPLIELVDPDVFTLTFAADCMSHGCRCRDEGDRRRDDACCQHGADVLIPEKAAILRRAAEIASVMDAGWRDPARWFDERDPELDPRVPDGIILRTGLVDLDDDTSGCVFLEHSGARGCGLHRAALSHGFDPAEIKPIVCRLYPLSLDGGRLGLSPDFDRYSCAGDSGPTVYRLMRGVLGATFGAPLLRELDRVESDVVKRKLRVVRANAT